MKSEKTTKGIKNLDLIIIIIAITVIGLVTAVILATRPYEVGSFEKITHVNIDNYKNREKNEKEYFVLLYDSRNVERYKIVEEVAVIYAEFARTNKEVPNIYVIDYRDNTDIVNSSNFNISSSNFESQIPCLVTITTSGTVSNKTTNISDICNLLEDYMSGKKGNYAGNNDLKHKH